MAHYDNYSNRGKPTKLAEVVGMKWRKRLAEEMLRNFTDQEQIKVLELGGGKGEFARTITQYNGVQYYTVEPNQKLAEILNEYGYVQVGFVPPIEQPDESMDIVYSSNVLEHVLPHHIPPFFTESVRVARKGGLIVTQTPNYLDMKEFFWDCDYTHATPFTIKRLTQMYADYGLEVEKVEIMRFGTPGIRRWLLYPLNRLLRCFAGWSKLNSSSKLYKLYLSTCEQLIVYGKRVS